MMKKTLLASLIVAPVAIMSAQVHADIRFNGFASIHMSSVDSDGGDAPFPNYASDGDFSFKDESLFAIQASSDLGDGLSATVQLMGEGVNNFEVEAKWAYLSYEISDTHRISAGRFANPIFYQSEYEKVGYAHNFARLPKAVYIGLDFSTVEGIALDSSFYLGDYNLQTKVLYGNWVGDTFIAAANTNLDFGLKNILSIRANLGGDWWNVFGGYFTSELQGGGSGGVDGFFMAASQPGVTGAVAMGASQTDVNGFYDALLWDGKDGNYMFVGFNINYGRFTVDFETTDYGVKDSVDAFNQGMYLAVGYRINDQMVVTVHTEENKQEIDYGFVGSVSNPILNATGKALHDAFAAREFDAMGISLRYDFHPSAALKVDYLTGNDSRPTVDDYSMMTIGVDIVF